MRNCTKFVSPVKTARSNKCWTFYNERNCHGENICKYYPGDVDLAVDDNFDNQTVSYQRAYNS